MATHPVAPRGWLQVALVAATEEHLDGLRACPGRLTTAQLQDRNINAHQGT